ncbi:unnamed protein product [Moneuplotes crassus]|uniref:AP2/ERF domain-containing protein n=1 Tax=Euplotes crassus TaxID=5936 RepID=A0AAD1U497_EUPCR|nr:unnamed protein product [Moneuplotes crassus]
MLHHKKNKRSLSCHLTNNFSLLAAEFEHLHNSSMKSQKQLMYISENSTLTINFKGVIEQLEKTYCVCPLIHNSDRRAMKYCPHEDQSSSLPSPSLKNLYNLGGENLRKRDLRLPAKYDINSPEKETKIVLIHLDKIHSLSEKNEDDLAEVKVVKQRRNRSWRLDITDRLPIIRNIILSNPIGSFKRAIKKTRYTKDKYLGRRSKYIGITKNNIHWQALINVNHEKKYIGTFIDEIEAAKTYDLHAIAMQGKRARLNFSYTPEEIVSMIDHYLIHRRINLHEDI